MIAILVVAPCAMKDACSARCPKPVCPVEFEFVGKDDQPLLRFRVEALTGN